MQFLAFRHDQYDLHGSENVGYSPAAEAGGHTDTMDVCLDRVGHLVVDNQADVLHVNTTTSKICSDEDVRVARAQRLQRSFSLLLVLARVQGCCAPLGTNSQHMIT